MLRKKTAKADLRRVRRVVDARLPSYLEIGKKEAKVLVGANRIGETGYFFEPTLFVEVAKTARITTEETSGPVGIIHKCKNDADILRKCTETERPLRFHLYPQHRLRPRLAKEVEADTISVSSSASSLEPKTPFSGGKQSGIGTEVGEKWVKEQMEEKTVSRQGRVKPE